MPQQTPSSQIPNLEHGFWLAQRLFNAFQGINGGVDLGSSTQTGGSGNNAYTGNLNGSWANVTAPGAANTEFAVAHTLGRIPSFYLFISDRSCNLYQLPATGTAWTQQNIYLKCTVASAVLRIFIL